MRKDVQRYPSNVVKCRAFCAYPSNFRFYSFPCLQQSTEEEEVEKGARAEDDTKRAEAANRQKQADQEHKHKVTFQRSAVPPSQFCAYVSRSFLSDGPRSHFDFCMSVGAHRKGGSGEARQSRREQKKGGGSAATKASRKGATAKGSLSKFRSSALSTLCIRIAFLSVRLTEMGF